MKYDESQLDQLADRLDQIISDRSKSDDGRFQKMIDSLKQVGDVYLFGGIVRRAILDTVHPETDLDIVVDCQDNATFEKILLDSGIAYQKHTYDHIKSFSNGNYIAGKIDLVPVKFDVWELQKSWVNETLPTGHVITIDDLTNSVFFSTDAIIYNLNTRKFTYRTDYFSLLKDNNIDVVNVYNKDYIRQLAGLISIIYESNLEPTVALRQTLTNALINLPGYVDWRCMHILESKFNIQMDIGIIHAYIQFIMGEAFDIMQKKFI